MGIWWYPEAFSSRISPPSAIIFPPWHIWQSVEPCSHIPPLAIMPPRAMRFFIAYLIAKLILSSNTLEHVDDAFYCIGSGICRRQRAENHSDDVVSSCLHDHTATHDGLRRCR